MSMCLVLQRELLASDRAMVVSCQLPLAVLLWLCLRLDGTTAGNVQGVAVNNTLTIAYSIPWSHDWAVGPVMGSAIVVGLEEVRRRQLLPGFDIEWVWRDSYCKPLHGIKMVIDMWSSVYDLDLLLGKLVIYFSFF